jgi:hypothetical protein
MRIGHNIFFYGFEIAVCTVLRMVFIFWKRGKMIFNDCSIHTIPKPPTVVFLRGADNCTQYCPIGS